jgi:Domain of unknown function (DUF4037)
VPGPAFIPGLELAGAFYREAVGPLIGDVPHSAALIGTGSDVLGFDTARSTDHGWGPRVQVFVDAANVEAVAGRVDAGLPDTFRDWPVRYGWGPVAVQHHVTVTTLREWLVARLGVDATRPLAAADWLVTPQQLLLGVSGGAVFRDDTGELARVREELAWYPDPVWRWLLGCQWRRLAQEEPFVQRTAEAGDELGSSVLAARLARDVMRLALLIARRYAPYSKWLGTAFARLDHGDGLDRFLTDAVRAQDLEAREASLGRAYEAVARRLTPSASSSRWTRSCASSTTARRSVLIAYRFADPCLASVGHVGRSQRSGRLPPLQGRVVPMPPPGIDPGTFVLGARTPAGSGSIDLPTESVSALGVFPRMPLDLAGLELPAHLPRLLDNGLQVRLDHPVRSIDVVHGRSAVVPDQEIRHAVL